jgi:hypothetical protein
MIAVIVTERMVQDAESNDACKDFASSGPIFVACAGLRSHKRKEQQSGSGDSKFAFHLEFLLGCDAFEFMACVTEGLRAIFTRFLKKNQGLAKCHLRTPHVCPSWMPSKGLQFC